MSTGGRREERRRQERRAVPRKPRQPDESWFGALGVDGELAHAEDERAEAGESVYDGKWASAHEWDADSRFISRQARRLIGAGQTAFQRIYGAFVAARAALGIVLIASLALASVFGTSPPLAITLVSMVYATLALTTWLIPRVRPISMPTKLVRLSSPQWIATIGIDIVCFGALHLLSRASTFNYVALLVLPILMSGVLMPRVMALATAALVTLVLLGIAFMGVLAGGDVTALMMQAGLAGSGYFAIVLLANELAGRLAREELTARGSLELARQQAQLNRLVIEEMQDGVMVVDRRGRVRGANPAARALLVPEGLCKEAPFRLSDIDAWKALIKAVERAFGEGNWPESGRDITLEFEAGVPRTVRVRMRFTRRREQQASEELVVLFLEDVRNMQARTRQEKLAAMGRVSAGIAHEIRNPLAAISQANALLAEDATNASQRQLTRMVTENVERLKRIVDDVMEVAPGDVGAVGPIDAVEQIATVCGEWARTAGVSWGDHSILKVELPNEPVGVIFDPDHLRRVLVNLLDNGYRHATKSPGAVLLRLYLRDEVIAAMSVSSDGEPIPPEVERYLFEPFFSTRSRGTGLGLYICRELCERYGARIDYRLRSSSERNRNEFLVAMRRQSLPASGAANRLHLTS